MRRHGLWSVAVCTLPWLGGCAGEPDRADLGAIYSEAATSIGDARNPVVVIPGVLGTKLESVDGTKVWGSFTFGAADADRPEGARLIALPMELGVPLGGLTDDVLATSVLDVVVADVGLFRGITIGAYVDILKTLAAGQYRDQTLGEAGAVDYGGLHYTCFQFAYDWRRDIAESAAQLDVLIRDAQQAARIGRGLDADAPVKVDVAAHSMGGMVLRYYLRYGTQPLPADGSLPELTWAGAEHVEHAILIGTPNAGSVLSFEQLVDGWDLGPLFPNYRASILGTMPAIYQLLPRSRHARIVDAETGEPIDLFDPQTWTERGWGLADPAEDDKLQELLPGVASAADRREIALDHLRKSLARASQLHEAIDHPAAPPPGLRLSLFAGDSEPTPAVLAVDAEGSIEVIETEAGDGTVTRRSAVMDERVGREWSPRLDSPIAWDRVQFLFADHIGLTRDSTFADNVLFMLLEDPRSWRTAE
ncbi:MAG: hypothetical protein AAFR96_10570 [Planctomycetota bacterium]